MFELWLCVCIGSLFVIVVGLLYRIDKLQKWQDETDEWADTINKYIINTQGKDCIGFKEE